MKDERAGEWNRVGDRITVSVRLPKTEDGEKQGDFPEENTSTLCDGLLIKRIPLFLKRWW